MVNVDTRREKFYEQEENEDLVELELLAPKVMRSNSGTSDKQTTPPPLPSDEQPAHAIEMETLNWENGNGTPGGVAKVNEYSCGAQHDGVFANLSAKPEVMVLPRTDSPPVFHFS
jgi:hypothetical protein